MMKEFTFGNAKGNLWVTEIPQLSPEPGNYVEKRHSLAGRSDVSNEAANLNVRGALEIKIPIGARVLYGLLGVRFLSSDSEDLVIRLPLYAGNEKIEVSRPLISKLEPVYQEADNDVLTSVEEAIVNTLGSFAGGEVTVHPILSARVSSSPAFFGKIASGLIKILISGTIDEDQAVELIRNNVF